MPAHVNAKLDSSSALKNIKCDKDDYIYPEPTLYRYSKFLELQLLKTWAPFPTIKGNISV